MSRTLAEALQSRHIPTLAGVVNWIESSHSHLGFHKLTYDELWDLFKRNDPELTGMEFDYIMHEIDHWESQR